METSVEALGKGRATNDVDLLAPVTTRGGSLGVGDTERDHDNQDGSEDADSAGDTNIGNELKRARQAKQPAHEGGDTHPADGADGVVAHGVEGDGHGDAGRGAGEDELDEQADADEDLKGLTADDGGHVDNVDDVRVLAVELEQLVGGVGGQEAEADDGDGAGDDAQGAHGGGQGQDADADLVGDEDEGGVPAAHGAVVLAALAEDVGGHGRLGVDGAGAVLGGGAFGRGVLLPLLLLVLLLVEHHVDDVIILGIGAVEEA